MKKVLFVLPVILLVSVFIFGGCAKPALNLVPPPTGHELLLKAFEESGGQTVDLVVDQEVRDVTVDMFNWWMVEGNIANYYRLWWPEMHYDVQFVTQPDGPMNVIIKEMIWPYYTEFRCILIPEGIAFLTPDGEKMGQLTHTPTASAKGITLHSVFTFPAKTPQAFLDTMEEHCNYEMQDFTRFLPELYKQKGPK